MILILILVAATNQIYSACPPCVKYQNPLPNHLLGFEINSDNCICKHELTRCAIVNPVCPTGKQCVLKNIPTCTFPPCELESAICEPFTSCPQVTCSNKCDKSGFMRDPNDCQTCVCNKPCDEIICGPDEKCATIIEIGGGQTSRCDKKKACSPCVSFNNPHPSNVIGTEISSDGCKCPHNTTRCSSIKPICPAGQQCVMKPISNCTFPPCKVESAVCEKFTGCPQVKCNDSCSNSGYVVDSNGCKTCTCMEPCKELTCPANKKCVVVTSSLSRYGRCDAKKPCPPCVPSVNSLPVHIEGTETNSDGCACRHNLTRCSTINPVCPKGQECVLKPISNCTFTPCKLETAVCVPFTKCPNMTCNITCPKSGYFKDQNGCDTCGCNEPCQEITCSSGRKCVIILVIGDGKYARCDLKEPCSPCVESGNPYPTHAVGFEINSDGCQCPHNLTRCSAVNPICPKGQQCTLKPITKCTFPPCKLSSAVCEPFVSCPQVKCSVTCTHDGYIRDPNGCRTCTCSKSCKDVTCPSGQKCVTVIDANERVSFVVTAKLQRKTIDSQILSIE